VGHAVALLPGYIHSIAYPDRTFFLRVTGGDVEAQHTLHFDPERQAVMVENRALRPRTA
jgi:hypothetical protein